MSPVVSRETGPIASGRIAGACREARKVDPVGFAHLWMAGTPAASIAARYGIGLKYVTDLRRRYGLPARKGGKSRVVVRQAPGLVAAIRGQERRDA